MLTSVEETHAVEADIQMPIKLMNTLLMAAKAAARKENRDRETARTKKAEISNGKVAYELFKNILSQRILKARRNSVNSKLVDRWCTIGTICFSSFHESVNIILTISVIFDTTFYISIYQSFSLHGYRPCERIQRPPIRLHSLLFSLFPRIRTRLRKNLPCVHEVIVSQ